MEGIFAVDHGALVHLVRHDRDVVVDEAHVHVRGISQLLYKSSHSAFRVACWNIGPDLLFKMVRSLTSPIDLPARGRYR
jgi:hypothetical protein